MMWLRKSKAGFTIIEMMIVVAIIGILSLLGMRVFTIQQNKAKNVIVLANASTTHTAIQTELVEGPITITEAVAAAVASSMRNPYTGLMMVTLDFPPAAVNAGEVQITLVGDAFNIQGFGSQGLIGDPFIAQ